MWQGWVSITSLLFELKQERAVVAIVRCPRNVSCGRIAWNADNVHTCHNDLNLGDLVGDKKLRGSCIK